MINNPGKYFREDIGLLIDLDKENQLINNYKIRKIEINQKIQNFTNNRGAGYVLWIN